MNLEKQEVSLHVFSHASNEAYAAGAYLKAAKYKHGKSSRRFVGTKTKVAPLEATSTLRLELMAALLSLKLAIPVQQVLEVPEKKIFYWIDSMNVL